MNIYHFNQQTGEYISTGQARLDPVGNQPMIPAGATTTPPPTPQANEAARWIGNAWEIVADHRGAQGYDAAGTLHKITELGQVPDPAWTDTWTPPPPTPAEQLAATDAGFIRVVEDLVNTLITKGVIQLADLPAAAQDKITTRQNLRAQL